MRERNQVPLKGLGSSQRLLSVGPLPLVQVSPYHHFPAGAPRLPLSGQHPETLKFPAGNHAATLVILDCSEGAPLDSPGDRFMAKAGCRCGLTDGQKAGNPVVVGVGGWGIGEHVAVFDTERAAPTGAPEG